MGSYLSAETFARFRLEEFSVATTLLTQFDTVHLRRLTGAFHCLAFITLTLTLGLVQLLRLCRTRAGCTEWRKEVDVGAHNGHTLTMERCTLRWLHTVPCALSPD
jgi:hypothetical protein